MTNYEAPELGLENRQGWKSSQGSNPCSSDPTLIPDMAFEKRMAIHIHEGGIPTVEAKDLAAQTQGFRSQAPCWAWLRVYVEIKRLGYGRRQKPSQPPRAGDWVCFPIFCKDALGEVHRLQAQPRRCSYWLALLSVLIERAVDRLLMLGLLSLIAPIAALHPPSNDTHWVILTMCQRNPLMPNPQLSLTSKLLKLCPKYWPMSSVDLKH